MKLNLAEKTYEFLKSKSGDKFTAGQIAEWIFATYPDACQKKKQASKRDLSDEGLVQALQAEIGSHRAALQKNYPEIKTSEGRPRSTLCFLNICCRNIRCIQSALTKKMATP